jgi:pimeloyl-ACP methyl ester carboxylesterase
MKVDVGGYSLFVRCTGQGSPPAVFDAGANVGHSAWSLVEPKVAAFTRTCVYDRATLENSDEGPTPNTSQQIVHDLHTLLSKMQLAGPFVLVGHSFGGMNMGLYARVYPTEAAGLVMVDAAHEASYLLGRGPTAPHQVSRGVDHTESARQVQAAPRMPAIPLIVIAHGLPGGVPFPEAQWHAWQQDLASRSPHSKLVVAEQSNHEIESDQPDLVVAAVREIVQQVR